MDSRLFHTKLEITHWSTRALAQVAVQRKIVPRIAHWTVSLILRSASFEPHRSRYWKTPTLNEELRQRAARILWVSDLQRRVAGEACFAPLRRNYERIEPLAAGDEVVLALDEKPNIQVLERRCPTRRLRPDHIERQEFEYVRHGTVNFLAALLIDLLFKKVPKPRGTEVKRAGDLVEAQADTMIFLHNAYGIFNSLIHSSSLLAVLSPQYEDIAAVMYPPPINVLQQISSIVYQIGKKS